MTPILHSWSSGEKILFRFFFLYFGLFILIQNNGAFPYWNLVAYFQTQGLHILIPWIGKNVLHLPYEITIFTNGSGDTTYDYVVLLLIFVTAVSGTLLWSLLDRNRFQYQVLYYWLTVGIRFYVGLMLINYGLVKVFKLQFPYPGLYRLTELYGDSSPMGLAWTFLGFSTGYNLFMGIAEVLAVLLLFRRTLALGAIITLMTTANVMAVNYFYDVPVKILSTHLVLMTLFLLLYNASDLWQFFLGNGKQLNLIRQPQFSKRWIPITGNVVKGLLVVYTLGFGSYQAMEMMKQYGDLAPRSKFYGLYEVDTFIMNRDTLPPLITDTVRWRHLILESDTYARVRMMNDSTNGFQLSIDSIAHSMHFTHRTLPDQQLDFRYSLVSDKMDSLVSDQLVLRGLNKQDSLYIYLNRVPDFRKKFRLTNRGFHWVNEYPYNR